MSSSEVNKKGREGLAYRGLAFYIYGRSRVFDYVVRLKKEGVVMSLVTTSKFTLSFGGSEVTLI